LASLASVGVAATRLAFGRFLNLPKPTPKMGDTRLSAHGSICRLACQKVVPENRPWTLPTVPSTLIVSASR